MSGHLFFNVRRPEPTHFFSIIKYFYKCPHKLSILFLMNLFCFSQGKTPICVSLIGSHIILRLLFSSTLFFIYFNLILLHTFKVVNLNQNPQKNTMIPHLKKFPFSSEMRIIDTPLYL